MTDIQLGIILGLIIAVPYGIANAYLLSRSSNKFGMVIEYLTTSDIVLPVKTLLIGVLFTVAMAVGIIVSLILSPLILIDLAIALIFPKLRGKLK